MAPSTPAPEQSSGPLGVIYLLHFGRPYRHAAHYTGWAGDLEQRLAEHAAGRGARLLAVVAAAGITWTLARTWEGTRSDERALKRQGGASRRCPMCGVAPQSARPRRADPPGGGERMSAARTVRLSWSAREAFSADVPEQCLTALAELDPIRRDDGSIDLDALDGTVDEPSLEGLLADLEIPENCDGVQEREIAEAYRLPPEDGTPADEPDVPGCSCGMADLGAPGHDQLDGAPAGLHVQDITADVRRDDAGRPFADVALTLDTGQQITLTVHLSLAYSNTVNVEIDGDFTADKPSLRINLNDCLIHDSTRNDPVLDSPRRPDLPDPSDRPAVQR